ncbi:MAG: GIY-YIG nuclease family protein [Patescibacteria group bacterium]
MKRQAIIKLKIPDTPGVYTFRDYKKRPIYIGRATSIKDRVKSYFSDDLMNTRGPRIVDMITKAKSLNWQVTDSVLEAIILESKLIKRYQPICNVDERDDKSSQYVVITDELWPRVFLERVRDFDSLRSSLENSSHQRERLKYSVKKYFGPYPHGGLIKEVLKILRKLFPFKDKKSFDSRHEAFYQALGRSPDQDDNNALKKYLMTIKYLILFFEGKKQKIRKQVEREMNLRARELRFEEAQQSKRMLYALDHINDIALIKEERLRVSNHSSAVSANSELLQSNGFRIEAYDIAHLSGTNVVGAMVVSIDGEFVPSEYRKFKISRQKNDDVAGLKEILTRRLNHPEWAYPDLIVVDGNKVQVSCAENILKVRRIDIPVVAVTKDQRHKAIELIGHPTLISKYKKQIITLNRKAHRFVISFHRSSRNKSFKNFK